jgi:hypothetical protein
MGDDAHEQARKRAEEAKGTALERAETEEEWPPNPSVTVTLGRVVAQLAAFVGIVAGFWHISWIAGVVFLAAGVVAVGVHSAGYVRLEKDERADVLSAETSPATQLRISAAVTRAAAGPASPRPNAAQRLGCRTTSTRADPRGSSAAAASGIGDDVRGATGGW